MKEDNDIGKIITQSLDSEVVNRFRYKDGSLSELTAEQIILYCLITRDSQLPEDLNLTGEILCNKIAEKLEIDEEHIDEKKDEIFGYIYNNLIKNGFCFHITNSTLAENIQNEGLKKPADTSVSIDIGSILNMMKKYENGTISLNLFPFSSVDINEDKRFLL